MAALVQIIGEQAASLLNGAGILSAFDEESEAVFAFIDLASLAEQRVEAEPPPEAGEANEAGALRVILLPAPRIDEMTTRDTALATVSLQLAVMRRLGCGAASAAGQARVGELMEVVDGIRSLFLGRMLEPGVAGEVEAFCERVETAAAFPRGYDVDQLMVNHRFVAVLILVFTTPVEIGEGVVL